MAKPTAAQIDRKIAAALAARKSGPRRHARMKATTPNVQSEIDDRCLHYHAMGRSVVLNVPGGRDWQ